jgi:hypothetical protein
VTHPNEIQVEEVENEDPYLTAQKEEKAPQIDLPTVLSNRKSVYQNRGKREFFILPSLSQSARDRQLTLIVPVKEFNYEQRITPKLESLPVIRDQIKGYEKVGPEKILNKRDA